MIMSSIADGRDVAVPPTIADASVLDELRPVLRMEPELASISKGRPAR